MAQAKVDVTVIQRSGISDQSPTAISGDSTSSQMNQGAKVAKVSPQMGAPAAVITDWASI